MGKYESYSFGLIDLTTYNNKSNTQFMKPFQIRKQDRKTLRRKVRSGLNLDSICSMLESKDLDSRLLALELIKECKQFYNYVKTEVYDGDNYYWKRAVVALREYVELRKNKNVVDER